MASEGIVNRLNHGDRNTSFMRVLYKVGLGIK